MACCVEVAVLVKKKVEEEYSQWLRTQSSKIVKLGVHMAIWRTESGNPLQCPVQYPVFLNFSHSDFNFSFVVCLLFSILTSSEKEDRLDDTSEVLEKRN